MSIDVHCHVIPNIDDGAENISVSLEMCRIAQMDGTHGIIATPHYIHGTISNTKALVHQKVSELKDYLRDNAIDLEIYPGCEAFISPELPQLVSTGQVCTLNNTRYILIELPMNSIPIYTMDVIYQLKLDGFIPVIAHPERNLNISKNPGILADLIARGALTQVNASSLKGLFGKMIQEAAVTLARHNMIHLLASDAHTTGGRSPKLSKAKDVLLQELGSEALIRILKNSEALLNDKAIDIGEPIPFEEKKGSFYCNIKKLVSEFLR